MLISACASDKPQSALDPAGPIARKEHELFVPVFWIAAAIFFLVEGLIIYTVVRFRDRPGREEPKQIHGNARLEFAWTLVPALILLGVAIPTVMTIFQLSGPPKDDAVQIRVIGHQWWWEYHYEEDGRKFVTANELVIPVGRSVFLHLESADVIHSFWVPRLAGKQDLIPERTNTLELIADKPGDYPGQCAEFCAIAHANMRILVRALPETEYREWARNQLRPPAEPTEADAIAGKRLFAESSCIACHAIEGVSSAALGPNLTHLASRKTFGAAMFELNRENLFEWVKHARQMKPGVLMPNFDEPLDENDPSGIQNIFRVLSDQEISQIVAYLLTLE